MQILFNSDLNDKFKSLTIDDERKHMLTKIRHTKKGVVIKESDHHVLIAEFSNIVPEQKHDKNTDIYNLKNIECQKKFMEYTTNTKMLSSIFNSNNDLELVAQRFIKKIN